MIAKKTKISTIFTGALLAAAVSMGPITPAFASDADTLNLDATSATAETNRIENNAPVVAGTDAITSSQANVLKQQKAQIIEFDKAINKFRKAHGRAPLTFNAGAATDAADWSKTQSRNGRLAHQNDSQRHKPFEGLWNRWGENVAYSYTTSATSMFKQWENSPGHRANMLSPDFTTYGIAFYTGNDGRTYGTTVFYRPWEGTRLPDTYTNATDYFNGRRALPTDGSAPKTGPFTDVYPGDSFYTHIKWLKDGGITMGYADGSYGVGKQITRGEAASFLYRISGDKHTVKTPRFKDAIGSSHATAIDWMADNGYTMGYADGTFKPNRTVTRAELASFTYRASDENHPAPSSAPFRDVSKSSAHYEAISWLKSEGNVSGYVDGTFKPSRSITRGETAKILYALADVK